MDRGLLTESQRAFLRGEKDDVDEQSYRYNVRSDFRNRMDQLEEDIEILAEAGEEDLVDDFYQRFGETVERRVERLEAEIKKLRAEMDE